MPKAAEPSAWLKARGAAPRVLRECEALIRAIPPATAVIDAAIYGNKGKFIRNIQYSLDKIQLYGYAESSSHTYITTKDTKRN